MSYILEALKDSQSTRENGRVPTLRTSIESIPAKKSTDPIYTRRWLFLVVVAVIAGGVAGWWLTHGGDPSLRPAPSDSAGQQGVSSELVAADRPSSDQTVEISTVDNASADDSRPVSGAEFPEPVAGDAVAVAAVEEAEPPGTELTVIQTSGGDLSKELPEKSVEPVIRVDNPGIDTSSGASPEPLVQPLEPGKSKKTDEVSSEWASRGRQSFVDPVLAPDPRSDIAGGFEQPVLKNPVEDDVPHFRELPLDIQQQVDWIGFSVHLYSRNPARRLVKIEGIVRREGSDIGREVTLDEITPYGAIFSYRDYRFKVPVR